MKKYGFRIYYEELGGHTHIKVFSGVLGAATFGKCGELIMTNEEFEAWRRNSIHIEWKDVAHTKEGQ